MHELRKESSCRGRLLSWYSEKNRVAARTLFKKKKTLLKKIYILTRPSFVSTLIQIGTIKYGNLRAKQLQQ